jgi:hypothetical protein
MYYLYYYLVEMSVFPKELANPPMTDLLESNTNNIFTIFSVTSNIQPPPYELFTILFSNNLLVTTVTTIPSVNLQDKYNLKKLFFKFTPPPLLVRLPQSLHCEGLTSSIHGIKSPSDLLDTSQISYLKAHTVLIDWVYLWLSTVMTGSSASFFVHIS